MAKIKIEDLPRDFRVGRQEMNKIVGGMISKIPKGGPRHTGSDESPGPSSGSILQDATEGMVGLIAENLGFIFDVLSTPFRRRR